MYTYIHMNMYIYIYMCIYIYVYVNTFIYIYVTYICTYVCVVQKATVCFHTWKRGLSVVRSSKPCQIDLKVLIVNPRKLEHRFRMIHAGIPYTLL